ncbi:helix-turn-helix domain-containing protein [Companilactobacillus furfuricola]|uniref:helix-turn-helix domain-containing protein n=1 Tax=Companilactobacillus furfuricola TaxID=1462575 RepID=UPI0013DE1B11|nr:helix-turn-helix transcriptional regulator [Companilactobacillus furfuricola]
MTFIDYGETTIPGMLEFIAFFCILLTMIFLGIGRFKKADRQLYLFLGGFELAILVVLITNIITFAVVRRDINIYPGPTLILLLLNAILSIVYGLPEKVQPKDDTTYYVDADKIRPISDILKEKREAAGVTQQELSEKVQVSRNTVYRWESGESHPNMDYIVRVAQALHFPVSDFWREDDAGMNRDIAEVLKSRKLYKQAAYFLLSVILVIVLVFGVAYLGRNMEFASLDRINPFIPQRVGYVMVHDAGKQKAAVIDTDYGEGDIVTLNGSYDHKTEFVKVVHKGSYVKYEVRNVDRSDVPVGIRNNLYEVDRFGDPVEGLKKLKLSYSKRYV